MRVRNYPITIMNKPAFKSKEYTDDGVLGYSDALSQKTGQINAIYYINEIKYATNPSDACKCCCVRV